jgi:hypothetical protein
MRRERRPWQPAVGLHRTSVLAPGDMGRDPILT